MKTLKVLWIDDEHEALKIIDEKASLNDIELKPFSNADDAITELKRNITSYDAAIVDGIFFEKEGQSGKVKDEGVAFGRIARALDDLKHVKVLPWFILSGQTTYTSGKNTLATVFNKSKVYDKNSSHGRDLEDLWADIRKEVEEHPNYQIRFKYQAVFGACDSSYCDPEMSSLMLTILKRLDERNFISDTNNYLTEVRKVVELLFKAFQSMGILPMEIYGGSNFISSSKNFLTGRDKRYHYPSDIMHPSAVMCLDYILNITQDGSHLGGILKFRVDEFIRSNSTDYLYSALVNMLCDLLVWFKGFSYDHKNDCTNRVYARPIPSEVCNYSGEIQQDNAGNYICGDYILNYQEAEQVHKLGQRIIIKSAGMNKSPRTKEKYPTRAFSFELLP
jgi:hypothetical protein